MSLANVTLSSTFDEWRVRTNQLISLYDETNELSRASYNATNLAAVTAANLAATIIYGNTTLYNTIYTNSNTITENIATIVLNTTLRDFYDTANVSYDQSNVATVVANQAYLIANASIIASNVAYDTANTFVANASNVVAEVLASNTTIQQTINNSATLLFVDYLANNDLTYVGAIANASFNVANTGDSTGINAYNTANAAFGVANTAGGGYYVGNRGSVGGISNKGDIFRINSNTLTSNIVFSAGENATATGPIYVTPNNTIEIQTGARVVII